MTPLIYEMTQGDPFYAEIAFADQYGAAINGASWIAQVDFKSAFSDASPLFSLTLGNGGLVWLTGGVLSLQFAGSALATLNINPMPRNGDLTPSRVLHGDIKLTPPAGTQYVQGDGARTTLLLKINAGVTA